MPGRRRKPLQDLRQERPQYGPAGQLLESTGPQGTTKYEYDPEGNLAKKHLPTASEWKYEWNGASMLAKVLRPTARPSNLATTPLGRRTWKTIRRQGPPSGISDGNVPVHEWVEVDPQGLEETSPAQHEAADWEKRASPHASRPVQAHRQGPPRPRSIRHSSRPITWVFEPESFAPIAKLTATARYGIVTAPSRHPHRHGSMRSAARPRGSAGYWCVRRSAERDGERGACPSGGQGSTKTKRQAILQPVQVLQPEAGRMSARSPADSLGATICMHIQRIRCIGSIPWDYLVYR